MVNLLKKDLILSFKNRLSLLLIVLVVPLFLIMFDFMNNTGNLVSRLIFIISHVLTIGLFDFELKNKPSIFINSLPVTRKEIIVSKYIISIINFTLATIFLYAYLKLTSLLAPGAIEIFNFPAILSALYLTLFSTAIIFPLYFGIPIKIAGGLATGTFIFIFNMMDEILGLKVFIAYSNLLMVLVFAIIYLISIYLSLAIYKNKDIS